MCERVRDNKCKREIMHDKIDKIIVRERYL